MPYIPVWLATVRASRAVYRWNTTFTERDRRRAYLESILTRKDEAKELRAFGAAPFLRLRYDLLYDERITELMSVVKKRLHVGLLGSLGTSALTGGALAFLIWLVSSHRLSLADHEQAATAAVVLLGGRLQSLASSAGQLYESSLFIEDFSSFVAWAPRFATAPLEGVGPAGPFNRLRPKRLDSPTRARQTPSLDGVSIEVGAGEIVALVGENDQGRPPWRSCSPVCCNPRAGRSPGTAATSGASTKSPCGSTSRWCSKTSCVTP